MNNYSILIPVHNEANNIPPLLKALKVYSDMGHEIIIIDDGSNDGSRNILKDCKTIKLIVLESNKGKGYAIKRGLKEINNEKVLIFDGDMEIDPNQISKLMLLDRDKKINAVFGYRYKSLNPVHSLSSWGNFMFTSFFNLTMGLNSKDALCCAKAFYFGDIKKYHMTSNGFDIDIELLTVLFCASKGKRVLQIFLDYKRRTFLEGKKLKVSDGWTVLWRFIKILRNF